MATRLTSPKVTIVLDWTTAPIVRITVNRDMPEYGVQAGDTVHLVRLSEDTGKYFILRWDEIGTQWHCPCRKAKPCRHQVAVNAHIVARTRAMQHIAESLQSPSIPLIVESTVEILPLTANEKPTQQSPIASTSPRTMLLSLCDSRSLDEKIFGSLLNDKCNDGVLARYR